jgi:hypothetical protein
MPGVEMAPQLKEGLSWRRVPCGMASALVSGPSLLVAGLTHRALALYIDAPWSA